MVAGFYEPGSDSETNPGIIITSVNTESWYFENLNRDYRMQIDCGNTGPVSYRPVILYETRVAKCRKNEKRHDNDNATLF